MIIFELFILTILIFDNSPKDWGSLLLPLIVIPLIGFVLLMGGRDTQKRNVNYRQTNKPILHPQSKPLFKANDILCMAIVYEGYLPQGKQINNHDLASEILSNTHAIGSLNLVKLSDHTLISVQRANENAYYQDGSEPKDDLPIMIQNLQKILREKMLANGDPVNQITIKNLMFKSHSELAGTLWVQINVLQ